MKGVFFVDVSVAIGKKKKNLTAGNTKSNTILGVPLCNLSLTVPLSLPAISFVTGWRKRSGLGSCGFHLPKLKRKLCRPKLKNNLDCLCLAVVQFSW